MLLLAYTKRIYIQINFSMHLKLIICHKFLADLWSLMKRYLRMKNAYKMYLNKAVSSLYKYRVRL